MSAMDFSPLTNDQLVELIRAACAEAGARGTAVEAAAKTAMLGEAERAQIAREAMDREEQRLIQAEAERVAREAAEQVRRRAERAQAEAEAARQQKLWEKKADISRRVCDIFGVIGLGVSVWMKDGEKRVYINPATGKDSLVDFYCTGNHRKKPGTLEVVSEFDTAEARPHIEALCEDLCKNWDGLRLTCDIAAPELAERLAREKREVAERAAERARVKAEQKAEEEKLRREQQAAGRAERQGKLRDLLGGTPIWAKNNLPVMPENLSDAYNEHDNGLRTVIIARTDGGGLRASSVLIRNFTIRAVRPLSLDMGI